MLALMLACAVLLPWGGLTQPGGSQPIASGKLLIASRAVEDPNFARTVVLLVRFDERGTMGLVLNRPTSVPLSRMLEKLPAAQKRTDPVFYGGPIGRSGVLALVRSSESLAGAARVLEGVYLISSADGLAAVLQANVKAENLRVFQGYAGWRPGRLEAEVALGFWHVAPASANLVFHSNPAGLWEILIPGETGTRAASAGSNRSVDAERSFNHPVRSEAVFYCSSGCGSQPRGQL